MTKPPYTDRIVVSPVPSHISGVSIALRYRPEFAALGRAAGMAIRVADAVRPLADMAAQGFCGAIGFQCAAQPTQTGMVLRLEGTPVPPALIVMATRIAVGLHDADPAGFSQLEAALDGNRAQALALWGGVDFNTAIAQVEISCFGEGVATAFDPFWLAPAADPLVQTDRMVFEGLGFAMPGPEAEDALLLASGFGAFWPLGQVAEQSLGDEEWFPAGADLVVTDLSCEAAALRLVLDWFEALARKGGVKA